MRFGYKAITPIKLLNGVSAYRSGAISFKALRVYLSCFELEAIREAAERSNKAKALKGRGKVCFRREELIALSGGLSMRSIGKCLGELEKASLMSFSKEAIHFTETPLGDSRELIDAALSGRKGTRAIPVPRRLLKLMAELKKPSLVITLIAYLIRGVSIDRRTGEVNPRGTVKASFIAEVFGVSLRAVKGARAEMISLGIISKDENSYQRKLNRDGAYFELNLEWRKVEGRGEREVLPVDNFSLPKTSFAPPKAQNRTESAPPKERLKTSYESKNQKTHPPRLNPSGVCSKREGEGTTPTIWNITRTDLEHFSRTETLYGAAVKARWIRDSESTFLNFIGAAVRAKSVPVRDPVRVFVSIVKRGAWGLITQDQEDRARAAIRKYRPEGMASFYGASLVPRKSEI